MENSFITATRNSYRFAFKGAIGVEDLWKLSVIDLDKVFKTLNAEKKQLDEESLLTNNKDNEELNNKIDIVKYIVSVKLKEKEERDNAKALKEEKQRLMEIIKSKKDEAIKNLSIEELEKKLEELE